MRQELLLWAGLYTASGLLFVLSIFIAKRLLRNFRAKRPERAGLAKKTAVLLLFAVLVVSIANGAYQTQQQYSASVSMAEELANMQPLQQQSSTLMKHWPTPFDDLDIFSVYMTTTLLEELLFLLTCTGLTALSYKIIQKLGRALD